MIFNPIKSCKIVGLHELFDIDQVFDPSINIIYGDNGSGKTTFLHILANIINEDHSRLYYLNFKWIRIEFINGKVISFKRDDYDERIHMQDNQNRRKKTIDKPTQDSLELYQQKTNKGINTVAYFPAFRSMIEAWYSETQEQLTHQVSGIQEYKKTTLGENIFRTLKLTDFSRKLFGYFVPSINYPSISEIRETILEDLENAFFEIGEMDRKILATSFKQIFSILLHPDKSKNTLETDRVKNSDPKQLLLDIEKLGQRIKKYPLDSSVLGTDIHEQLDEIIHSSKVTDNSIESKILEVYKEAMKKIVNVQEKYFAKTQKYLDSINIFLMDKNLEMYLDSTRINLGFKQGDKYCKWEILSSGEKQIITLIYAAIYMSSHALVLIDEPEISLHVDWQRKLLKVMSKHLENKQVIACTHSPVIGASYYDYFQELNIKSTDKNTWDWQLNKIEKTEEEREEERARKEKVEEDRKRQEKEEEDRKRQQELKLDKPDSFISSDDPYNEVTDVEDEDLEEE